MKGVLRIAMCATLALSACRRPAPEDPWAWEKNPGLDPHPAGQTLQGPAGPKASGVTFRLDPARGAKDGAGSAQPATEEDALYLRAARSGQAWAQTKIGIKYVMESDDLVRLGEGLRWLNTAADQNETEALRMLSALAAEGRGMDQSDNEAYKYMSRAAELGSPEAQYELANMLANGRGLQRDMEAALVWGRKAAEQGHAPAQFAMGRVLIESVDLERKSEGLAMLESAAEAGKVQAVIFLANVMSQGDFGIPIDEQRVEKLLKPLAESGEPQCQFLLASLYRFGKSFQYQRELAQQWLQRSAQGGNEQAKRILEEDEKLQGP
jgi:TPR repeat protein